MACNKCYNWFPLGVFAWIGGWLLLICVIVDMITTRTGFVAFWLYVYLIVGALLILVIDLPLVWSMRVAFVVRAQIVIYDYVKLFRRIWGRSILYLIMMITCGSFVQENGDFSSVSWVAGPYMLALIILSLIFSVIAAKKYMAVREYIIKATVIQRDMDEEDIQLQKSVSRLVIPDEEEQKQRHADFEMDEEIVMKKLISKFDELDADNTGKLNIQQISKLGEECGNAFSNAEKHAIFLLLDKECNGAITKPSWILQLKKYSNMKML